MKAEVLNRRFRREAQMLDNRLTFLICAYLRNLRFNFSLLCFFSVPAFLASLEPSFLKTRIARTEFSSWPDLPASVHCKSAVRRVATRSPTPWITLSTS